MAGRGGRGLGDKFSPEKGEVPKVLASVSAGRVGGWSLSPVDLSAATPGTNPAAGTTHTAAHRTLPAECHLAATPPPPRAHVSQSLPPPCAWFCYLSNPWGFTSFFPVIFFSIYLLWYHHYNNNLVLLIKKLQFGDPITLYQSFCL